MQTSVSSPSNLTVSPPPPNLAKYQKNSNSFSNKNTVKNTNQNFPISLISQNATLNSNDKKWTNNMLIKSKSSNTNASSNLIDQKNNINQLNNQHEENFMNNNNQDKIIRKYSTVSNMPAYFPNNNKTLPTKSNSISSGYNNEGAKKKISLTQYPQPLPQPPPANQQNLRHNNHTHHLDKNHQNSQNANNSTTNELNNSINDPIVAAILNNTKFNHFNTNSTSKNKYLIEYPFKKIKFNQESSIVWNIITLAMSFFLNLTVMLPVAIIMGIIFPLKYLFRLTFKLLHICHLTNTSHSLPDLVPEFLTPTELFWFYNSNLAKQPNNPNEVENLSNLNSNNLKNNKSTGACLLFIDGYLPISKIKDLINNKIIKASERTNDRNFERFTQRVYNLSLYGYVWLTSANFNIDEHIIEIENNNINTNQDLQIYISKLMSSHQFKINKPLWSIYYKKGFGPEKSTVLLFIYHMCFSDGISLIRLFFKGIIDNRMELDIKPRFAYFSFYFDLLKQIFFGWSRILYYLISMRKDRNPIHSNDFKSNRYADLNFSSFSDTKSPIDENARATNSRSLKKKAQAIQKENKQIYVWSEPFDLVSINRLKLVTRCKLNEFLISIVAGVIRNYLQLKGINHPRNINCIMPVDLSSNKYPFKLKQKSTFSSYEMPVNSEGIIPRLWNTRNSISFLKSSSNYILIYYYKYFLFNLLPNSMAFALIKNFVNKNTIVASTLGAGDTSLASASLCNRNVKNIIYFYPPLCDLSISFSIVTYGEEVRMSLVADSNIITHPKIITTEFIRQLDILNELLSNRRIPGEVKRITRPIIPPTEVGKTDIISINDELSTDEMQQKMADIQQELQQLTETLKSFDKSSYDSEYIKQKQAILIKSENLRKEFRNVLMKYQLKQSINSQTLPSDDENELDPIERVRLRSHSIASRASSNSNSKKNKDSNPDSERGNSSRKPSIAGGHSRRGSVSFASGISNGYEHSGIHDLSISNSLTVENEFQKQSRSNRFGSQHITTLANNNFLH